MKGLYDSVSLKQAVAIIRAQAESDDPITYVFEGEIGIGKSAMLTILEQQLGDKYYYCYVDMTVKDVGDFLVPFIREVNGQQVTSFIPNEEFGFHLGKPVVMMLDEVGKTSKAVLNCALRLINEQKLGMYSLPAGSIVIGTTNLAREGVGDVFPPHARNRVAFCKIRKPSADEWVTDYALMAGVAPEIIQAVTSFPDMLASFEDYENPADNEYIFHPGASRPAFTSPRSLEKAGKIIVAQRGKIGNDELTHILKGTVGARAAMDIMVSVNLNADLPRWEDIIKSPEKTEVPKSAAAVCMLIYQAVQRTDKTNISKWLTYCKRFSKEQQALFATTMMRTSKSTMLGLEKDFIAWAGSHDWLFSRS